MVGNFNIKNLFNGFFDGVYPRVAKLDHLSIGKDNVVVVPVKIRFFVMGLVLPKLMFANQPAFQQEFNGIVEGSPTYAIVLVLHVNV